MFLTGLTLQRVSVDLVIIARLGELSDSLEQVKSDCNTTKTTLSLDDLYNLKEHGNDSMMEEDVNQEELPRSAELGRLSTPVRPADQRRTPYSSHQRG